MAKTKRPSRSNGAVAQAFVEGRKLRSSSGKMYTCGRVVYSFGSHFPIAIRLDENTYLFNSDSYSQRTNGHQSRVRFAIPQSATVYHCSTQEIIDAVRRPGAPIIIKGPPDHIRDIHTLMSAISFYCHNEGLRTVPVSKWKYMMKDHIHLSKAREILRSKDPKERIRYYTELGKVVKDNEAVLRIVTPLLRDPDPKIAAAAVWTIMNKLPVFSGKDLLRVDKMARANAGAVTEYLEPQATYIGGLHSRPRTRTKRVYVGERYNRPRYEKEFTLCRSLLLFVDAEEQYHWVETGLTSTAGDVHFVNKKLSPLVELKLDKFWLDGCNDDGRDVVATAPKPLVDNLATRVVLEAL